MQEKQTIYNLPLHEFITMGGFFITRVPGGWIYENNSEVSVFVPYSDEFVAAIYADNQK